MKISDCTVFITKAAVGLGKSVAEALLKGGAKVAVADVAAAEGEAACADFKKIYGEDRALFTKCDVTDEQSFKDAFASAVSKFGNINLMLNNAWLVDEWNWKMMFEANVLFIYTYHGRHMPSFQLRDGLEWTDRLTDLNIKDGGDLKYAAITYCSNEPKHSVIIGTQIGIEHMRKDNGGKGGVILNLASISGLVPAFPLPTYSATKHAVVAFTNSWAANPYLGEMGIRFGTICPTAVDTIIQHIDPKQSLYPKEMEEGAKQMGLILVPRLVDEILKMIKDDNSNGYSLVVTEDTSNYAHNVLTDIKPEYHEGLVSL